MLRKKGDADAAGIYVKVSMDGAPYLRKVDLNVCNSYPDLLKALEKMFKFTIGTMFSAIYISQYHMKLLCLCMCWAFLWLTDDVEIPMIMRSL